MGRRSGRLLRGRGGSWNEQLALFRGFRSSGDLAVWVFAHEEFGQRFAGVLRSVVHLARKMPHDPVTKPARKIGTVFAEGCDGVLEMGIHHLRCVFSIEGKNTSKGIVVDATDGIHVGALVERGALELFRSHEMDRAEDGVAMIDGLE